jgi:hypothetical protein
MLNVNRLTRNVKRPICNSGCRIGYSLRPINYSLRKFQK